MHNALLLSLDISVLIFCPSLIISDGLRGHIFDQNLLGLYFHLIKYWDKGVISTKPRPVNGHSTAVVASPVLSRGEGLPHLTCWQYFA